MRRVLLLSAKATTSILLLYLSLRWVNVGALGERLSQFELGWIALAVFLLTAQVVLLAARWGEIPYRQAVGPATATHTLPQYAPGRHRG